ncbi:ornithine cyclodeaminase family protein [Undibacterium sp. TJN19]|uniref:ornithine cyclodeaminase family protein n=1 Tax=Undibacterium sp. TJN19 TaxID=3413055 RepID=UPI003BF191F2
MEIIKNEQIASLLTTRDAIRVMREAFHFYGQAGASQDRVRIDCDDTKLSMMGAIIPGLDAVGAKIYTTIKGRFSFVVLLFSASTGALLAVMEGDAMTEFRTAAVTALAADALARKEARCLAVFGTGVQARAHVPALMAIRNFSEILVCGIDKPVEFAQEIANRYGVSARAVSAAEAASAADIVLTATRAGNPLFDGQLLKPGAFVAAIGSSKPDTREVDDHVIRRSAQIVVESKSQAKNEAGDLLLCAQDCFDWGNVNELANILAHPKPLRQNESQIFLYKAIGVGLEDVALAEFVYRQVNFEAAGKSEP